MFSGFRFPVYLMLFLLAVVPAAAGQDGARQEALFVSQPEIASPIFDDAYLNSPDSGEPTVPVEYRDVVVDEVITSVQTRRANVDAPRMVIQADPVAEALHGYFQVVGSTVSYQSVDGGDVRSLDVETGILRSNGIAVGGLPISEAADIASLWLTVEDIAALTGTQLLRLPDGTLIFETEGGSGPMYDFDLWVDGRSVAAIGAEPRMVGKVLLLPLRPIAAELGHNIRVEPGAVEVVRVQDSKIVRLDLASGLVSVNGIPAGVTGSLALADLDELLLPYDAIEALTGAHVSREPNSNRIRVDLDDRFDKSALPGAKAPAGVGHDPFTPEALSYQLSDRGPIWAEFSSRIDRLNSRLTYESAGGVERSEELQPTWASMDVQNLDGWAGTAGDYTTGRFRELSGVDVARIRGLSFRQQTQSGDIFAVAAGATLTGTAAVSDTATKPEFGGFAGGVRLLSADGTGEIGASAKSADDGDTSALVVSGQRVFDQTDQPGPLKSVHVAADAGYFDTLSGRALDARIRASAQYRLTTRINAAISAYHDGEKFGETANPAKFEGVFDNRVGARTGGSVSADWRSARSWGVLQFVSIGGRASIERFNGAVDATASRLQAGLTTRIGANGPVVAIDADRSEADLAGRAEVSDRIQVRAAQSFDWGAVQARYVEEHSEAGDREFAVFLVQGRPVTKSLGEGARASIAPTVNLGWIDRTTAVRVGATAALTSGRKLGDRFALDGQVSALSSVDPDEFGTRYFADLQARYRVDARTELVARYVDDFDGRKDLSFALRGTIMFNEPRKLNLPLKDYGESKANGRDWQPGERVRKAAMSSARTARADTPVTQAIELRGAVFIDLDRDGVAGPGDQRLEGQAVQVINTRTGEIDDVTSAAFGQFGVQDVSPGAYRIRVMVGWQEYAVDIAVDEDEAEAMAAIAIPPEVLGLPVQHRVGADLADEQAA